MTYIPSFPARAGEDSAVEFAKDGQTYRIVRVDGANLLIHRKGSTAEAFEMLITNLTPDGTMFDVFGRGDTASITALGADRSILSRLF
tara:strand:+ start:1022 stop:1285 length:264 start_codon:yes stop_codon:yes gene_type:complete